MEAPITVTQQELLSLTPELCAQVMDATIKCRITREVAQILLKGAQEPTEEETYLEELQLSSMTPAHNICREEIQTCRPQNPTYRDGTTKSVLNYPQSPR